MDSRRPHHILPDEAVVKMPEEERRFFVRLSLDDAARLTRASVDERAAWLRLRLTAGLVAGASSLRQPPGMDVEHNGDLVGNALYCQGWREACEYLRAHAEAGLIHEGLVDRALGVVGASSSGDGSVGAAS